MKTDQQFATTPIPPPPNHRFGRGLLGGKVESLIEHGTGTINEDFLLAEKDIFGVFDGATSLTSTIYEHGYTGGFLASNLAGQEFQKNNGSLVEMADQANMTIRQAMTEREVNLKDKGSLWSASAAVAKIEDNNLEWAQIGDCQIICIHENGNFEFLCSTSDQDVETLSMWQEIAPTTDAPIGEAMHEQILKVRSRMNVDYGVFSGEPEAMNFLKSGKRSLEGISHVLLLTDGLLIPNPNPRQKRDFREQIELFQQGGLQGVRDHIRRIEATDTKCRIYPRFKTHDDIAAVAISV